MSPAPVTLPSHASLLTALDPPAHGVRNNSAFALDAGIPTLAEHMRAAGFATGAVVAAFVLDARFGLARGFDHYDDDVGQRKAASVHSFAERPGNAVVDAALAWLDTAPERFFLWVHLYDPHANYQPPPRFASLVPGDPYAGEIAFADAQVGRLLAGVRERFGPGRLALLVTSDHGESRHEHGELTHALTLYDATQRVPLLLASPGLPRGGVVREPVRLIDVAPTLLELAGAAPLPDAQGRSLVPLARGDRQEERLAYLEAIEPQLGMGWSPLLGVRTGQHKYIRAPRPELYDLESDPGELRNRAAQEPERVAELDAALEARLATARPPSILGEIDPADRARLEGLGYLVPQTERLAQLEIGKVGGPDPKDHMAEVSAMYRAGQLVDQGFGARALALLAPIERPGPRILLLRAHAASQAQRPDVLMEAGRALVALQPDDVQSHHVLATAHLGLGDLDAAERSFERARALDPSHPSPIVGLGLLARARGDRPRALAYFEQADALEAPPGAARLELVFELMQRGELERAASLLETVPDAVVDVAHTAVRIADAEERAGLGEAALRRIQRATARHRDSHTVWATYARLLGEAGRLPLSIAAWRHVLSLDPGDAGVQNNLAWSLALAGHSLDEALRLARQAVAGLGEGPGPLDTLATVHLARGEASQALAAADRALADAPSELRAHLLYVRAASLAELGRLGEARRALASLRAEPHPLAPPWTDRATALARRLGVAPAARPG